MEKLGHRTKNLLMQCGLGPQDIDGIECGDISWDLIPVSSQNSNASGSDLLLFSSEGGSRPIARLSESQVEELINAWEFERRENLRNGRSLTFPCGEFDDWTGIKPESDWHDFIIGYREAVKILASTSPRATAAPYLYLCRHTLELQMKAVIMLGQQSMDLIPDLPSHHDLQKLWTATFPIATQCHPEGVEEFRAVRQVVDDYHAADMNSISFRYPVTKGNKPVAHADFIHEFSHNKHSSQFDCACDILDIIINKLRRKIFINKIFGEDKREAGDVDPIFTLKK